MLARLEEGCKRGPENYQRPKLLPLILRHQYRRIAVDLLEELHLEVGKRRTFLLAEILYLR